MKKYALIFIAVAITSIFGCKGGKEVKFTPKNNNDVAENVVVDDNNNALPIDTNKAVAIVDTSDVKEVLKDNTKGSEKVMEDGENGTVKEVSMSDLKETTSKTKTNKKKFYVIAGSYKDYRWAKNVSAFYKKKGYPVSIMKKSNGYIRVSLGNYEYRVSAERQLKKFRAKKLKFDGKYLEYWMLLK